MKALYKWLYFLARIEYGPLRAHLMVLAALAKGYADFYFHTYNAKRERDAPDR